MVSGVEPILVRVHAALSVVSIASGTLFVLSVSKLGLVRVMARTASVVMARVFSFIFPTSSEQLRFTEVIPSSKLFAAKVNVLACVPRLNSFLSVLTRGIVGVVERVQVTSSEDSAVTDISEVVAVTFLELGVMVTSGSMVSIKNFTDFTCSRLLWVSRVK